MLQLDANVNWEAIIGLENSLDTVSQPATAPALFVIRVP
jgi:hypothetical protein